MRALLLACILVLALAVPAFCAPLVGISFDEADDQTGTACDSFLFDESGAANEDQDISLGVAGTDPIHDNTNGGSTTSKRNLRVSVATSEAAQYSLKAGILPANLQGASFSIAVHIPSGGDVSVRRPIACFTETSTADLGCCLVQEPGRLFSLAYLAPTSEGACSTDNDCDGDEKCFGTTCRKWWATSGQVAEPLVCSSNANVPCDDAMDCPGTSPSCGSSYHTTFEVTQFRIDDDTVRCELYEKGKSVTVGAEKTVSGASDVDAINSGTGGGWTGGAINFGSLSSAATYFMDDLAIDDSTLRAGHNYVAGTSPSGMSDCATTATCAKGWSSFSCTGTTEVSACLDDYEIASNYTYDSGSDTNNVVATKFSAGADVGDFPVFGPSYALRTGDKVTAVDLYAFGLRGTAAAQYDFRLELLACPQETSDTVYRCTCTSGSDCGSGGVCNALGQCIAGDANKVSCATPNTQSTCATNRICSGEVTRTANCAAQTNSTTLDMTTGYTAPTFLQHVLATSSPSSGQQSWQTHFPYVGARMHYDKSGNRRIYVGALQANTVIRKLDTKEESTFGDHNKGVDDGQRTVALIGASTLYGTAQLTCSGGSNSGAPCSQDSYCSWAADPTFQDQPPGGCMKFGTPGVIDASDHVVCRVCTNDESVTCTSDGQCDFGTCDTPCGSGVGTCCSGNDNRICGSDAQCQVGPCQSAATCIEACPCPPGNPDCGSTCPSDRAGWGTPIVEAGIFDNVLTCAVGAETSGRMLVNRFPDIVAGISRGWSCPPGTPNCSSCHATVGSGTCRCTTNADCDPNGDCQNGLCTGNSGKLVCTEATQCAFGLGCQFPPPDELWIGVGVNDQFPAPTGTGTQATPFYDTHDPECRTLASAVSYVAFPQSWQPPLYCPQPGTGVYQRNHTTCGLNSTCTSGVAPDSTCFGVCSNTAVGGMCFTTSDCQNQEVGTVGKTCTMDAPLCDFDNECTLGRTCWNGHPGFPGVLLDGRCACASDANCPTNYHCVGDSGGPKFCRWRGNNGGSDCTTNGHCPGGTCDTSTCNSSPGDGKCDGDVNFCTGKCQNTCSSIVAADDAGCGERTYSLWGGMRFHTIKGKRNPASGRCGCCGITRCDEHEPLMTRGCSCVSSADCPGGTCVNNECSGGARGDCREDLECAVGQRCMRCTEALDRYHESHRGLLVDVVQEAVRYVKSLPNEVDPPGCSGNACELPKVAVTEVPFPGGLTNQGFTIPDIACWGQNAAADWPDRGYYARLYQDLLDLSGLPPHRVISQSVFNAARMLEPPLFVDHCHETGHGAALDGGAWVTSAEKWNVCLIAGAAIQRYCRNPDGQWPFRCSCTNNSHCGTGGSCVDSRCVAGDANRVECAGPIGTQSTCNSGQLCSAAFCTSASGCAPDESCDRRRCDGDIANCPGSVFNTCGPD